MNRSKGASISVVGTQIKAETNSNGQYALAEVPPGTLVIRVQLIGYNPAERSVTVGTDRATVDFTLAAGVAQLEEIVSVGYGSSVRAELSTAVSSVASDHRQSADREHRRRPPGEGPRRAGDPERGQSGQRHERPGPRHGLDLGQQRSALRRGGVPIVAGDISQLESAARTSRPSAAQPRRHRAGRHPEGRRGDRDLRLARVERRGRDHHQARDEGTPTSPSTATSAASRPPSGSICSPAREYLEFFRESAINDGYGETTPATRRGQQRRGIGRTPCSGPPR